MTEHRVYNFYPGPATLPTEVMEQAQKEFVNYQGLGMGIMECSHRGKEFDQVLQTAEQNIRELMGISNDYAVLFLQGGASLQFSMVPMNLNPDQDTALYADTGSWAEKAIKEAKLLGPTKTVFSGKGNNYTSIDDCESWDMATENGEDPAYLYVCSNNTIFGTQFHRFPEFPKIPLVADMSSDIMSRVIDINRFGMVFAGAQKNLGPAGVTVVIIRKDLAMKVGDNVPTMLKYTTHIDKGSCFNTPPTFSIYMVGLVLEWIKRQGGLAQVEAANAHKAAMLYSAIDNSDLYRGTVEESCRSQMNVTFRLPNEDMEAEFIKQATENGMVGLKGHRSVGGIRASIYNAMPVDGVKALVEFMGEFERKS